jgi:hypothetical protein
MRPDQFAVKGRGVFPFDMLRYDRCFPASERDSRLIEDTTHPRRALDPAETTVTLAMADPKRLPTEARWASFRWTVVDG